MMSCERTILACSLSELAARRKLKYSSENYETIIVEAIEKNVEVMRRPFLSRTERNLAESIPETALREYFKPGEFVHIPMTGEEKVLIDQFKKFNKRKGGTEELSENDLTLIAE